MSDKIRSTLLEVAKLTKVHTKIPFTLYNDTEYGDCGRIVQQAQTTNKDRTRQIIDVFIVRKKLHSRTRWERGKNKQKTIPSCVQIKRSTSVMFCNELQQIGRAVEMRSLGKLSAPV